MKQPLSSEQIVQIEGETENLEGYIKQRLGSAAVERQLAENNVSCLLRVFYHGEPLRGELLGQPLDIFPQDGHIASIGISRGGGISLEFDYGFRMRDVKDGGFYVYSEAKGYSMDIRGRLIGIKKDYDEAQRYKIKKHATFSTVPEGFGGFRKLFDTYMARRENFHK